MIKIKNKIFNLSFPRSGTSSFTTVMRALGYKAKHWDKVACDYYLNNDYNALLKIIKYHDAFSDFPWPLMYKYLSINFPSAYFVLFEREENEWLNSCLKYFKEEKKELHGGNKIRSNVFGSPFPIKNEKKFKLIYANHIENVKKHFHKKNNFISIRLGDDDDWKKFCKFARVSFCEFIKCN